MRPCFHSQIIRGMQIMINGEPHSLPAPLNINELLESLSLAEKRLAVELNGEILPRSEFGNVILKSDDQLEIVHAIGGGQA